MRIPAALQLAVGISLVGTVGGGKMRKNSFNLESGQTGDRQDLTDRILGIGRLPVLSRRRLQQKTESSHPAVDLDMNFDFFACWRRSFG